MKNEKIIEKLEELVSNLKIQLNTPDPTTFEAEGKYMQLLLNADKIESELSALRSEDEKQKNDPNLCCVCHKNYVDSADGFDTCQSCINNI